MTDTGSKQKVAVVGGGIAGVAAAWSLHRSGFPVELFEKGPALGGNARTFRWKLDDGYADSPLLVIAWPERYYHNYHALLAELGLERTTLPITYFVRHPDGVFCQDGETELHRRLAPQFSRWNRLIRACSKINDAFVPKSDFDSLYGFSYWNPLNLIPLYRLSRLFGVSDEFWRKIFVPVHCASMITTSMKDAPAVIAPLLESIVPLEQACEMATWAGSPREVFDRMAAPFAQTVHTGCEITSVRREGPGFRLGARDGESFGADRVVFACQAPAALAALERPSRLERLLLGRVQYVDDVDPTFSHFTIHSDTSIFPAEDRERIASGYNTYVEVDTSGRLECTFVLSAGNPGLRDLGRPMLVTFNSTKAIEKVEAEIPLPNPTHTLSLRNLVVMIGMRRIQGRRGVHYCGSFTTPEGGHDLSFLSGLVVARQLGADYPFDANDPKSAPALNDYHQMQRIMLGHVPPDGPSIPKR
jgi:hypothetical protein